MLKTAMILIFIIAGFIGCSGSDSGNSSNDPEIKFYLHFNDHATGVYNETHLCEDWNCPSWNDGVSRGRVEIIDENGDKAMRVFYPEGKYGPSESGAQWKHEINNYDELYFSYRIKFEDNFDFVRGGKLPGLAGGTANTGGNTPNGSDGWSARMMWKRNGGIVQYVYHPDQYQNLPYGDEFPWESGGQQCRFVPGVWYHIEVRIVMNTPQEKDGIIQAWLNGIKVLDRKNIRFRDVENLSIDIDYFSTFFGGGDSSWAATKDEFIFFDDFIISTRAITH